MSCADESSTSATRSSSVMPYRRRKIRKSPDPSRAARRATSVSGVTSRPAVSTATPVPTTTDNSTASPTSASAVHCSARRYDSGTDSRSRPPPAIASCSE